MYLVIAEKPSVSRTLAKVIGAYKREDGYLTGRECIVSWCLGHLAEYAPPEAYGKKYKKWEFGSLPILPEKWELQITEATKKQFEVLKGLLNRKDFTYVVNACDAGREGELIFKRVYDLSGSTLPVRRLWISSMEDAAISDGFANLKDSADYEKLAEAAVCRAKADWLVGMNGTRAFTTTYGKVFKVGRVQTPTLAMLVERQKETEGFQKELYYKVRLDAGGLQFFSENIRDREEAARMAARCNGRTAVVEEIRRERKNPHRRSFTILRLSRGRRTGNSGTRRRKLLIHCRNCMKKNS